MPTLSNDTLCNDEYSAQMQRLNQTKGYNTLSRWVFLNVYCSMLLSIYFLFLAGIIRLAWQRCRTKKMARRCGLCRVSDTKTFQWRYYTLVFAATSSDICALALLLSFNNFLSALPLPADGHMPLKQILCRTFQYGCLVHTQLVETAMAGIQYVATAQPIVFRTMVTWRVTIFTLCGCIAVTVLLTSCSHWLADALSNWTFHDLPFNAKYRWLLISIVALLLCTLLVIQLAIHFCMGKHVTQRHSSVSSSEEIIRRSCSSKSDAKFVKTLRIILVGQLIMIIPFLVGFTLGVYLVYQAEVINRDKKLLNDQVVTCGFLTYFSAAQEKFEQLSTATHYLFNMINVHYVLSPVIHLVRNRDILRALTGGKICFYNRSRIAASTTMHDASGRSCIKNDSCCNKSNRNVTLTIGGKNIPTKTSCWLSASPVSNLRLLLNRHLIRVAVSLRLGIGITEPHRCRCGEQVDQFGTHGRSCKKSQDRHPRHKGAKDIIKRALATAGLQAVQEPPGLVARVDGKRPNGMTMVPYSRGRCMVWDFTAVDTMAPTYCVGNVVRPEAVAVKAEAAKRSKLIVLPSDYDFIPIAGETFVTLGQALALFSWTYARDLLRPQATRLKAHCLGRAYSLQFKEGMP